MNTIITRHYALASIAIAFCFISLCPFTVRADTPAQTQKAIQAVRNRAAASYERKDLSGPVAMYSPDFVVRNVSGRKVNFRQNIASIANVFAKNNSQVSAVCTASQVVTQGNQARAILRWHYVTRTMHATPPYVATRNHQEQPAWKKTAGGWQEVSADLTHDTMDYHR